MIDAPNDGEAVARVALDLEREELVTLLNLCAFGFMTLTIMSTWDTADDKTKRGYHFVGRVAAQATERLGSDRFNALQGRMAKLLNDRFEAPAGSGLAGFDVDENGGVTPVPKKRDLQ